MIDMLSPPNHMRLTLADFLREDKRRISGVLFEVLFNLHKFLRFEMRDPFQEKLRREDGFVCDWDRFAHFEYHRLSYEEEQGNNSNSTNNNSNVGYKDSDDDDDMFSDEDLDLDDDTVHPMAKGNHQSNNSNSNVNSGNSMNEEWSLDDDSDDDYIPGESRGKASTSRGKVGSSGGKKATNNNINNNSVRKR